MSDYHGAAANIEDNYKDKYIGNQINPLLINHPQSNLNSQQQTNFYNVKNNQFNTGQVNYQGFLPFSNINIPLYSSQQQNLIPNNQMFINPLHPLFNMPVNNPLSALNPQQSNNNVYNNFNQMKKPNNIQAFTHNNNNHNKKMYNSISSNDQSHSNSMNHNNNPSNIAIINSESSNTTNQNTNFGCSENISTANNTYYNNKSSLNLNNPQSLNMLNNNINLKNYNNYTGRNNNINQSLINSFVDNHSNLCQSIYLNSNNSINSFNTSKIAKPYLNSNNSLNNNSNHNSNNMFQGINNLII